MQPCPGVDRDVHPRNKGRKLGWRSIATEWLQVAAGVKMKKGDKDGD